VNAGCRIDRCFVGLLITDQYDSFPETVMALDWSQFQIHIDYHCNEIDSVLQYIKHIKAFLQYAGSACLESKKNQFDKLAATSVSGIAGVA